MRRSTASLIATLCLGVALCGSLLSSGCRVVRAEPAASNEQVIAEIDRLKEEGHRLRGKNGNAEALQAYQSALEKARVIGDERRQGVMLYNIGSAYLDIERLGEARERLAAAAEIFRKLALPRLEGLALVNLSATYHGQQKYEEALDPAQRALVAWEKVPDRAMIILSVNNLDSLHATLGWYARARAYHTRALELRKKWGTPDDVAYSWRNLGLIAYEVGSYEEALAYYLLAAPVLEKQKGSDALRMHGGILNDIGTIYFEWGQAVNARRYFHRARQVLQDGGQHDLLPDIWSNLSSVELRLGHLTEAKAWSERALVLERKQGFPEGSPPTRINQALVRLAEGRTGEAEKELSQLLKLPSALLPEGTRALTLFNLGCAYLLQNRFDAARQYLTEGRKLMETTGNRLAYAKADCALGILYYNMKQDQVALEALKKAMQHLESAGAEVADPGQYGAFQDQFLNPYEAAGAILHRQGNAKEALETVEQGRAVGLARQASQTRAGYGLLSPPDLNALRQGRDDLFKAGWSLRKSQRLNNGVPAARKQYEDAEARLNVLRTSLRQRYPEYARLGAGASTSGRLAELARQHPDTLYLEWAVIDDKTTLLFALSHPSGVRSFLLPIGAKALEERVARWRVALTAPAGLNDAQQPQMDAQQLQEKAIQEPREALGLYRLLLEPLEEKGILSRGSDQKFKRVVTVGDGPLLELPWAALLDSKGRRLFERYAVSSSFSLQALTWPDQRKPATDSFFYVADPRGPKEQQLRADLGGPVTEKDKPLTEMPSLPEAREGSVEAARLFPRSKGLKGSEASESAVKARISECTVLHFATHGLLLKPGLESWLLLAPDTKEDGYLFAGEVAEMQLAARLAVLSACESGRGEIRGGEGLLGLAWGFRASGCPSVVASLWKVKALTTSKLINAFYAGLRKGLPKDLALQHAMRVVKKGAGTSEPYFWAGFQVLGDPSPLKAP